MNTFLSAKSDEGKIKPSQVLGGILGGFDEIGFEMESPLTAAPKAAGSIFEAVVSLGQDISGIDTKPEELSAERFPQKGTIEFNKVQTRMEEDQKKKKEARAKRIFFQALKDDQQRAEQAKNRILFEEEINDIATNMPTDEKNRLLHYQANYRDRSIYQRAELRKKIIEQRKEADKKQKEVSIAQTQKKPSAMQAAFEGGSGTQGSGQSNLSFQATG